MVAVGIVVAVGCDWIFVLWWLVGLKIVGLRKRDKSREGVRGTIKNRSREGVRGRIKNE